jgi:hypothetical protein
MARTQRQRRGSLAEQRERKRLSLSRGCGWWCICCAVLPPSAANKKALIVRPRGERWGGWVGVELSSRLLASNGKSPGAVRLAVGSN